MTMEEIAGGGQQAPNSPPSTDMFGFLHKYRQLNENIDYAVTK